MGRAADMQAVDDEAAAGARDAEPGLAIASMCSCQASMAHTSCPALPSRPAYTEPMAPVPTMAIFMRPRQDATLRHRLGRPVGVAHAVLPVYPSAPELGLQSRPLVPILPVSPLRLPIMIAKGAICPAGRRARGGRLKRDGRDAPPGCRSWCSTARRIHDDTERSSAVTRQRKFPSAVPVE